MKRIPKLAKTHSTPYKLPGLRALLERLAALPSVGRIAPGRVTVLARGGHPLRLIDSGVQAGISGHKYKIITGAAAMELFIIAAHGRLTQMEAAIAAFPEYVSRGNAIRLEHEIA